MNTRSSKAAIVMGAIAVSEFIRKSISSIATGNKGRVQRSQTERDRCHARLSVLLEGRLIWHSPKFRLKRLEDKIAQINEHRSRYLKPMGSEP
ncbi:hypothetical protein H6F51_21530 [Cyanobacteria bacterium FACHB-DQ100]|nr:hypothetical protein [Cyanobacteria bacterium FACHB-DQ100]